jgi:transposase-like protein
LGRVCTICTHEKRFDIEELLATRQASYRNVAQRFGVSLDAVGRHVRSGHIGALLALAADAERAAQADTLLDRIEALHRRTLAILEAVEDTDEYRTALAAIREARANLELIGQVTKELDRAGTTINWEINVEWQEVKALILTALGPHPAAREAVFHALTEAPNGNA